MDKPIDMHTHLGDPITARPIESPLYRHPGGFVSMWERMGYMSFGSIGIPRSIRPFVVTEVQLRLQIGVLPNLIASMDIAGIGSSVVFPIEPGVQTSEILAAAKRKPQLLPFASVHPKENGWREKLKSYMKQGALGLKVHPIIQNIHPEDNALFELMEEYEKYGKPVTFHTGVTDFEVPVRAETDYGRVIYFRKIVEAFPNIPMILAHMGLHDKQDALRMGRRFENVYVDTSFSSVYWIKKALNAMGSDRVLFGSDWPASRPEVALPLVLKATKGYPQTREKLLFKNAKRLLGLDNRSD